MGDSMSVGDTSNNRRGARTKAVLPIRLKGTDSAGKAFEDMAHTLDVTPAGVRLGSVRHELNLKDEVTIFYRTRKMQYRVVWIKKLKDTSEFQVGLQAVTQDKEAWGLSFPDNKSQQTPQLVTAPA
jgi:hypothetical protein